MGRAVSGGSIAFDDEHGAYTITAKRETSGAVSLNSRTFSRTGFVAGSDIDALIAECFPAPPSLPGQLPGVSHLYAESLEAKPMFANSVPATCPTLTFPTYDTLRVSINYATLPYDSSDLLTRRYSLTGEFMSMPGSGLRWESDPKGTVINNEDVRAQKRIQMIEHSITYHRVTTIPWAAIRANIGKVNNGEYEGAADQSLLFAGADIVFVFSATGTKTWSLEYRLHERVVQVEGEEESSEMSSAFSGPFGWNHIYNPDRKRWERVLDDDGSPLYPLSSTFADLFA